MPQNRAPSQPVLQTKQVKNGSILAKLGKVHADSQDNAFSRGSSSTSDQNPQLNLSQVGLILIS